MNPEQFIVNFKDATGWHTDAEYMSDGTPEQAEKWASVENNILFRLINDGLQIPLVDDPTDLLITRVVVSRKSDGGKVCEWPATSIQN